MKYIWPYILYIFISCLSHDFGMENQQGKLQGKPSIPPVAGAARSGDLCQAWDMVDFLFGVFHLKRQPAS